MHIVCRAVCPDIVTNCELTCIERRPIDLEHMQQQHNAYVNTFRQLALDGEDIEVIELPVLPGHADSMFVEDVAMIYKECAVLTRPGAVSRQGEVDGIVDTVRALRPAVGAVMRVEAPGTIEGGDVFCVGKYVFVGKSTRTNDDGYQQVKAFLEPFGYEVVQCPISKCLHLKSAVSMLADDTVRINPDWVEPSHFTSRGLGLMIVDASEPDSANVVSIVTSRKEDHRRRRRTILVPAAFPKMQEQIHAFVEERNNNNNNSEEETMLFSMVVLEVDEVAKAEGALTCCSLIFY
eukprot:PhM_4_TR18092/c1_g2_i1/m.49251/K01482/DDAH, ddaH; dimethylargininase